MWTFLHLIHEVKVVASSRSESNSSSSPSNLLSLLLGALCLQGVDARQPFSETSNVLFCFCWSCSCSLTRWSWTSEVPTDVLMPPGCGEAWQEADGSALNLKEPVQVSALPDGAAEPLSLNALPAFLPRFCPDLQVLSTRRAQVLTSDLCCVFYVHRSWFWFRRRRR